MYDGSFQGFLTAVAEAFETGARVEGLSRARADQPPLFANLRRVLTNRHRAERLWQKLEKRSPSLSRLVYFSYLSEMPDVELLIYKYLYALFNINSPEESSLAEWRQRLENIARRVESEKRELERNLSFVASAEGIPCACASPTTNVLPLLSRHLKSRFAGQAWMIYDSKRNYGVYWHGGQLELTAIRPQAAKGNTGDPAFFKSSTLQSLLLPKVLESTLSGGSGVGYPIGNAV